MDVPRFPTVTLPGSAALNGSVSDDGLPVGGALTVTWSKVSGPGDVAFGEHESAGDAARNLPQSSKTISSPGRMVPSTRTAP